MDIKEYLRTFSRRDYEIQKMKEHLILLKAMAVDGSSAKVDGILHAKGRVGSRVENFVCKAIDLETQIRDKEDQLKKDEQLIREVLNTLSFSEQKTVVSMRYFQHYSWKQIALELGYSLGWVYKIHGEALDQLRLRLEVVA